MPVCFQLFRKTAVPLNTIDAELCKLIGVEVHPTHWVASWFNSIGYLCAMGRNWNAIRDELLGRWYSNEECFESVDVAQDLATLLLFVDYLEANYSPSAWRE